MIVATLGAFVEGTRIELPPTGSGPLDGLTFAVKDLIDVAGTITGGGNPDWRATQQPATRSAPVVDMLLAAGARLVGKTITDEMAFSLEGRNAHYGTPRNPSAPDRLPGGSSSGSASAVAGGLVDFALGTDTGGSVRIPAAFCGLYGLRPTHGRIPLDGLVPFAPSYDTIGVFARDARTLQRTASVLLPGPGAAYRPRLLIAEDAFAAADQPLAESLEERLPDAMRMAPRVRVFDGREDDWREAYRVLQGIEIWRSLGPWIERSKPRFGPDIASRFADAAMITQDDAARWIPFRRVIRDRLAKLLEPDGILILPTSPSIAPLLTATPDDIGVFYRSALTLTSIAGHTGMPQITVPVDRFDRAPIAISMIGAAGMDANLLAYSVDVFGEKKNDL